MTERKVKYTLVRHSAYEVKEDPQFQRGVESKPITTAREEQAIRKAGGMVFDSYSEAEDYGFNAEYQDVPIGKGNWLTPEVPGSFSSVKHLGYAIWLPPEPQQEGAAR